MSDDPQCQEHAPDDATNQCCVVVYCSSQDEDYYSDDDQPTPLVDQRLPESVLKTIDLSAKPPDGSEEFSQTELHLPLNDESHLTSPGGRLPENVLKQVDLSAKPADGSDEFLQVLVT